MTRKELENEIYKRLVEIQEMYLKAYPKGDCLEMRIKKTGLVLTMTI